MVAPITGALFQPYVGAISDRSRSPWGRRKLFIIVGTLSTIASILLLRQSADVAAWFTRVRALEVDHGTTNAVTQTVAVIAMVSFSFTTCVLQAGLRPFIVESCPSNQQEQATAWVCRFVGIGSLLLYMLSSISLPNSLPWLGNTQFKALCMYSCLVLATTMTITCIFIRERQTTEETPATSMQKGGFLEPVVDIIISVRGLSRRVKKTMLAHSCAWYTWFTFLYYVTS
jgi:solute carrier family 45, member 1/2/4